MNEPVRVKLDPLGDKTVSRITAKNEISEFRTDLINKDPFDLAHRMMDGLAHFKKNFRNRNSEFNIRNPRQLDEKEYKYFEEIMNDVLILSGGKVSDIVLQSTPGKFANKKITKMISNLGYGIFEDEKKRKTFAPMMSNLFMSPKGFRFAWERLTEFYTMHSLERMLERDGIGEEKAIHKIIKNHFDNLLMIGLAKNLIYFDRTSEFRSIPVPCGDGLILGEAFDLEVEYMKENRLLNQPNISVINIDGRNAICYSGYLLSSFNPKPIEDKQYIPVWVGKTYVSNELLRSDQKEYVSRWNELKQTFKQDNEKLIMYLAAGEKYGTHTRVFGKTYGDFEETLVDDRVMKSVADLILDYKDGLTAFVEDVELRQGSSMRA